MLRTTRAGTEVLIGGRYRLECELGHGGMGSVWAAIHAVTGRPVALKFLRADLAHRREASARLLREARAAVSVSHPNVIEVYDIFDLEDGTPVMVMQLLHGETLGKYLGREAPLSLTNALDLLGPVVSAVGTAHERGVIHRDLKPDNVFLSEELGARRVRVLDFGIAKLAVANVTGNPTITRTGAALGTPCYMAPEQAFGESDVDHRADVWAIGAMLYEALSGARPVEGSNLGQVVKSLMTQAITPISVMAEDVPERLAELVMRMLAREREERPDDLREVFDVFREYSAQAAPEFGEPLTALEASNSGTGPDRTEADPFRTTTGSECSVSAPIERPARQRSAGRFALPLLLLVGLPAADGFMRSRGGAPRTRTTTPSVAVPATDPGTVSPAPEVALTARDMLDHEHAEAPAPVPLSGSPRRSGAGTWRTRPLMPKRERPTVPSAMPVEGPVPSAIAAPAPTPNDRGLEEEPPF